MYKILHWLFGWDYVLWVYTKTGQSNIVRVRQAVDGTLWYKSHLLFGWVEVIKTPKQVIWLTCCPSKYFGVEKE